MNQNGRERLIPTGQVARVIHHTIMATIQQLTYSGKFLPIRIFSENSLCTLPKLAALIQESCFDPMQLASCWQAHLRARKHRRHRPDHAEQESDQQAHILNADRHLVILCQPRVGRQEQRQDCAGDCREVLDQRCVADGRAFAECVHLRVHHMRTSFER